MRDVIWHYEIVVFWTEFWEIFDDEAVAEPDQAEKEFCEEFHFVFLKKK